jgi:sulfate transport system substrate-binding protein
MFIETPRRPRAFTRWARSAALALVPVAVFAACSTQASGGENPVGSTVAGGCTPADTPVINFAAYSTPREAYGQIIPAFASKWKEEHDDQNVIFQESYAGSTTQAANVIAGYEADVMALSLGPDVDQIADAGLITHDWTDQPDGGMVSTSVVVFDVRPGNPLGIQDWNDLAGDVEILTPDPASSGGARWNLVSLWGAALRGYASVQADDTAGATTLMQDVLSNVIVFDKNARDSIQNFEAGNGDVAITYENEVLTAQEAGLEDEAVYPPSTVLIENPVAVVDQWVDEHCVRDVAEAFVEFLHSDEAKAIYTEVGHLRSTDVEEAKKGGGQFPPIEDLFTVDEIGGWDALNEELFSDSGIVTQAIAGG